MPEFNGQEIDAEPEVLSPPRLKWVWRGLALLGVLVALGLAGVWLARERIANRIIVKTLAGYGLPATYKIEKIGTTKEILTDIVIGDPAHPDLTVERAEVQIVPTMGTPTVGRIKLFKPRLYGTLKGGKFSFGALDKVLFRNQGGPKGLPDLDVALVDGRGRLATPSGPVGLKLEGAGNLRGGFVGTLAAIAPALTLGNCKVKQASAYGRISVTAAAPHFVGPVRLGALDCTRARLAVRDANVQLTVNAAAAFNRLNGSYVLRSSALGWQTNRLASATGAGKYAYAGSDLAATYQLKGVGLDAGGVKAATVMLAGELASHDRLGSFASTGLLSGTQISPGASFDKALAGLEHGGQGTLIAPVAAQMRTALARETNGSSLAASFKVSQAGLLTYVVIPAALWRGGSGAHLAELSQLQLTLGGRSGPLVSGNLRTDGAGLPHIQGRIERRGAGGGMATLSLAEYRAGDTAVALPELKVVQLAGGAIGFAGRAIVSGALPGGRVDNLALPIDGSYSGRTGLAALLRCTPVSFDRFKIANLALTSNTLTLCPGPEGAILRSDARGFRVAAGTPGLALQGLLGTTAVRLRSGPVGMAWPGALAARAIDVSLGPVANPTTLKIAQLRASLGKIITGQFSGTELKLNAVPLDVFDAAGNWRFANSELTVAGASLTVKDRLPDARFYPLVAQGASLSLHSTTFTADAALHEPKSDRLVVNTHIVHDLDTAAGHADLLVPGIVFDKGLQPETLTYMTQGVIALTKGTVYGKGDIDWNRGGVTSTGAFTTDKLDFAAQFGPVKGASGTAHFTDLLNLVTAPHQQFHVDSVNPGIEVNDGVVDFQLEREHLLVVNGAKWPFIDGSLELKPTQFVIGSANARRLTIKVEGMNLAKFVQRMGLSNISASGIFDGELPLIFDQNGGRIEGGFLASRPPGGNLSYVGELTYKDLSAMGNFAFQALRSLNFKRMEIGLNGHIDGEIVTKLRIDGVGQGTGARRNFITKRFAKLPIRFNINIRGPFHQLVTSFKSLYDPSYVRDPRSLGLIPAEAKLPAPGSVPPPKPAPPGPAAAPPAPPIAPKDPDIQHSDSRTGI